MKPGTRVYSLSLKQLPDIQTAEGVRIRKATPVDYFLSMIGKEPKLSLSRHIKRGDEYFLAMAGRTIAAMGRICYSDLKGLSLEENEAFLISFSTELEFRRQGLYMSLIGEMLCHLKRNKFERCYIWADSNNTASCGGIEKVGFQRVDV